MIIFLRSTDAHPDSRLQKYTDYLTRQSLSFRVFCWDRNGKFKDTSEYTYYKRHANYGGGLKNSWGLIGFNLFLIKQLFRCRKSYQIIHACDFDTILPALLMKMFCRKIVVYDIFDWFVDSRNFHNAFLRWIILQLEKFALKRSEVTIICEEERKKQLCYQPIQLWVLPNIPNFSIPLVSTSNDFIHDKIRLSYVGVFASHRGLEKVIEIMREFSDLLELNIAGFGELEPIIVAADKELSNIHYYGSVPYEKGLEIMKESDLILALYEKTIPNHIYAAPNKYYEGLFLGKPILTTEGTYVGIKTENYKTGFAIGEKKDDLEAFFSIPKLGIQLKERGSNAAKLWIDKYRDFVNVFFETKYFPFLISGKS